MEKFNVIKNGVLRLPPGFRFHPTDEELVVQYLLRKVLSLPLPASIIQDFDVCKSDPWDLPGESEQERYFFSCRESKYPHGNRSNRATGSGYWKATGLDKTIVASRGNRLVGMKKTLVFYKGKPPNGTRTDWVMHEYRLAGVDPSAGNASPPTKHQIPQKDQLGSWVLCRVFLKKRSKRNDGDITRCRSNHSLEKKKKKEEEEEEEKEKAVFYDFMSKERTDFNNLQVPDLSNSKEASEITEVSHVVNQMEDDHEDEENSGCSIFLRSRRDQVP